MKRVIIVAPTGMLGSMIYNVFKDKYKLILLYRNEKKLQMLFKAYGKAKNVQVVRFNIEEIYNAFLNDKGTFAHPIFTIKADAIINCAGLTKPNSKQNTSLTFFINGAFPHLLSMAYKEKLIQITTDCVYSGREGAPYRENAIHDPEDLYGLSKSLGEPSGKSLVLRTSIIGPEICDFNLLVSWFQKQKEAKGFVTHLWNGMTTKQFAIICDNIISRRSTFPAHGLFHIFSDSISKYELLKLLVKKYNPSCIVTPIRIEKVDRRLATLHSFSKRFHVSSLKKQIQDL